MTQKSYKSIITGLMFIGLGVTLLMHNLNLLPSTIPQYIFTWKMLLIVGGVYFFLIRSFLMGIILMGIGAYFLFPETIGLSIDDIHLFWPALLIVLGLMVLLGTMNLKKKINTDQSKINNSSMENSAIFSGESKQYSSYDFNGGKITAIFGGLEIDLVNCCLTKENNVIEVMAVCGGISLTVPKEWNVKSEIISIMAGVHDTINETPNSYVDPAAELTLKGLVVMGGIEIKRV